MRDVYDHNRKEQEFRLSTQNLDPKHTRLPVPLKFGPKWIGPYSIVRKIHNHAYEINTQSGNKLHPVFNMGSLKPYQQSSRLSRPHDVVLADGSIGQLVQRLLGKRFRRKQALFLVEWVDEEKSTWEPIENLVHIPEMIAELETNRRSKRRKKTKN
ncbi:hypothetical protein PHMEG_0009841 [Phytophthora megakarya]|uniref:Chromo domain-containing protein n=1 Tax=Phytophthora megakarya TaxID=4795 RepID=A0A225WF75_9STRA|nr:hypothetical protein PHMEG_0009841 [Phytophthora megakarya]